MVSTTGVGKKLTLGAFFVGYGANFVYRNQTRPTTYGDDHPRMATMKKYADKQLMKVHRGDLSDLNKFVLQPETADQVAEDGTPIRQQGRSQIETVLGQYEPGWFKSSSFLMTIASLFSTLPPSTAVTIDEKLVKQSRTGRRGKVEYNVLRSERATHGKEKVVLIVPGATGESEGGTMQLMSRRALDKGYHVFICNPLAPKDSGHRDDLELIDLTKSVPIKEAVETLREQFGSDVEIYGLGFSLGSNHLLRHLGSHKDCKKKCGIVAAMSVSGAFDLPVTGIELQYSAWGIYDFYMLGKIKGHFLEKKFKNQHDLHDRIEEGKNAKSLFKYDSVVRAPLLGFKGGHQLYRAISCNAFVADIETPVFVLTAKDDPITRYKHVPVYDIKKNPNMFLVSIPYGGHYEFSYKTVDKNTGEAYNSNYIENVAFSYFDRVHEYLHQQGSSQSGASSELKQQ